MNSTQGFEGYGKIKAKTNLYGLFVWCQHVIHLGGVFNSVKSQKKNIQKQLDKNEKLADELIESLKEYEEQLKSGTYHKSKTS